MSKNDGGAAFPRDGVCGEVVPQHGMTLRDYFAGQALAGQALLIASPRDSLDCHAVAAESAYAYADAMLEVRERAGK